MLFGHGVPIGQLAASKSGICSQVGCGDISSGAAHGINVLHVVDVQYVGFIITYYLFLCKGGIRLCFGGIDLIGVRVLS